MISVLNLSVLNQEATEPMLTNPLHAGITTQAILTRQRQVYRSTHLLALWPPANKIYPFTDNIYLYPDILHITLKLSVAFAYIKSSLAISGHSRHKPCFLGGFQGGSLMLL